MLPIIFVAPIIQLLVLANAATFDIKDLRLFVIDKDQSSISHLLVSKFEGSPYFKLAGFSYHSKAGELALERGEADLVIEIPGNTEKDLFRLNQAKIQLTLDAIDGTKAGLGNGYATAVIADLNQEIRSRFILSNRPQAQGIKQIEIQHSPWYNPEFDYRYFMVPGILVLLVTMIGAFLSAMNVVREKEIGTIEQLNVTPIKKYQFVIGKLLPFWIIGLFELALGLVVAEIFYDIPFVGQVWVIFLFAGIYLLVVLGMGLYISTTTETQQQAMFISWFFLVVFLLMSGLFTPIENMPDWAQTITLFNPVRYFIEVVRMVMLKGAGLFEIRYHILVLLAFALAINGLAVWRYRKTA